MISYKVSKFVNTDLLDDAHQSYGWSQLHMVVFVAYNLRLGNHYLQINELRDNTRARRELWQTEEKDAEKLN